MEDPFVRGEVAAQGKITLPPPGVDSIRAGEDFVDRLAALGSNCDDTLAMIGPDWPEARDKHRHRLDGPDLVVKARMDEREQSLELGRQQAPGRLSLGSWYLIGAGLGPGWLLFVLALSRAKISLGLPDGAIQVFILLCFGVGIAILIWVAREIKKRPVAPAWPPYHLTVGAIVANAVGAVILCFLFYAS